MHSTNIMTVQSSDGFSRPTYWIDCPIDTTPGKQEVMRIEIPRELATYMSNLQARVSDLEIKIKENIKCCG